MIWCLHGAFGQASNWRQWESALQPWGIAPVSLWEETWPTNPVDFASALRARAEARDPAPVLLGYSLGGRLALTALLQQPSFWRAAILVSAHPGLREDSERRARLAADQVWLEKLATMDWPNFWDEWSRQPVFGGVMKDRPESHPRMSRALDDWSLGRQENLWPRLGEITEPVLWVAGEKDEKFSRIALEASRLISGSRLYLAKECHHRAPWEDAHFGREVAGFLSALP